MLKSWLRAQGEVPQRIILNWRDKLKAVICWILAFRRTYRFEPGLYYTGKIYDSNSPILVTSNYHLTVYMVLRHIRNRNLRLLIIDTDGINVWCSAGKGKFSADEINKQLQRYDNITLAGLGNQNKIKVILPKLSLSGVSLSQLRKLGVKPFIGPVYASELPAYLDDLPLKNRSHDRFLFNLKDRLFTLLPTLLQMLKYAIPIAAVLFIWHLIFPTGIHWQVILIFTLIVLFYILFFPILPSKRFTIKGVILYLVFATLIVLDFMTGNKFIADAWGLAFYLSFVGASVLFFSLSYTGDSGVSNYSLVKKEIIRVLPITIVLYIVSFVMIIIKGVKG